MIALTPCTAFMVYLSLTLAALLGIWAYQYYRSRHRIIISSQQEAAVCEFCHFVYLKDSVKKITQCPQCLSFNSSEPQKK